MKIRIKKTKLLTVKETLLLFILIKLLDSVKSALSLSFRKLIIVLRFEVVNGNICVFFS